MERKELIRYEKVIFSIIFIITVLLLIFYFNLKNYEYVYYTIVTLVLTIPVMLLILKYIYFPKLLTFGIGVLIVVNLLAGGIIKVNGVILYEWVIIPLLMISKDLTLIKFDQIVHLYGTFIVTLMIYYLIRNANKENKYNSFIFLVILFFAGFGAGSFYEIVEFYATSFEYNAVGEYYNTLFDLCFNAIGALLAVFLLKYQHNSDSF